MGEFTLKDFEEMIRKDLNKPKFESSLYLSYDVIQEMEEMAKEKYKIPDADIKPNSRL